MTGRRRGARRRFSRPLPIAVAAVLVATVALASPARHAVDGDADSRDGMQSLIHEDGFTPEQARERASLQARSAGLDEHVRAAAGDRYAGTWFALDGVPRLRIGLRGGRGDDRAVAEIVADVSRKGLAADVAVVSTRFSLAELRSVQDEVGGRLLDLLRRGVVLTAIDPSRNAVVVEVASGAAASAVDRVEAAARASHGAVEVRASRHPTLEIRRDAGLGPAAPAQRGVAKSTV